MAHEDSLINERVVSTAERIEDMESPEELDPLEIKVQATIDGTARSFVAVLGTGGPHIEVDVTNGVVRGYWGGDEHSCHVNNPDVLDALDERYGRHWEENTVA